MLEICECLKIIIIISPWQYFILVTLFHQTEVAFMEARTFFFFKERKRK